MWTVGTNRAGAFCAVHTDGTHDAMDSHGDAARECCRRNFLARWESRLRVSLRPMRDLECNPDLLLSA